MPLVSDDPSQAQLIAARRNQILDAATQVFAAKGVARATIRDIAREARIADGTIYNYFANKDALLLGILDRLNQSDQRAEHFAEGVQMSPGEFARQYLGQRMATLSATDGKALRVVLSELLVNEPLRTRYYEEIVAPTLAIADDALQEWQKAGLLPPGDAQVRTRALAGMVLGLLLLRWLGDPYLDTQWASLPNTLMALFAQGLFPLSGGDDATGSTHSRDDQTPRAAEAGDAALQR